jgi:diaminohydroxyphosphoribosylaminopyrimidine deaminase/5-amino-6-(5-phosphoribosylamino)uracil reductase
MFDFTPPGTLEARPHLRFHRIDRMGDDVRILARFADVKADAQPLS